MRASWTKNGLSTVSRCKGRIQVFLQVEEEDTDTVAPEWEWAADFMVEAEVLGINKIKSPGGFPPRGFRVFFKRSSSQFYRIINRSKAGF